MKYVVQPVLESAAYGPSTVNQHLPFVIASPDQGLALADAGGDHAVLRVWNEEDDTQKWRVKDASNASQQVINLATGRALRRTAVLGAADNTLAARWSLIPRKGRFHFQNMELVPGINLPGSSESDDKTPQMKSEFLSRTSDTKVITKIVGGMGSAEYWTVSALRDAAAVASAAARYVELFEHTNYQGRSLRLGPGSYLLEDLKNWNDLFSSLRVPLGLQARLYADDHFHGITQDFSADCADLRTAGYLNDQTSSIVITPGALVYSDFDYRGQSKFYAVGRYATPNMYFPNDAVSSIRVGPGVMVRLYERNILDRAARVQVNNRSLLFTDDVPNLAVYGFNDVTSSVVVAPNGVVAPRNAVRFGARITLSRPKFTALLRFSGLRGLGAQAAGWQLQEADFTPLQLVRIRSRHPSHACFGDVVALQLADGRYVSTLENGTLTMAPHAREWEWFMLARAGATESQSFVSDQDAVSLQSFHGKFIREIDPRRSGVDALDSKTQSSSVWMLRMTQAAPLDSGAAQATGACGTAVCGANICVAQACQANLCGEATAGVGDSFLGTCGAAADGLLLCGADVSGTGGGVCMANVAGVSACFQDFAGLAACGAAACGAAVGGISACGAAVGGISACGVALCGMAAVGLGACVADACPVAACGAAACGGAACGVAAALAVACGADACGLALSGVSACGANASGLDMSPLDACSVNVCGIDMCPADACAADACAIDLIPIIPGI